MAEKKRLLPEKEIYILTKRFNEFHYKRNMLMQMHLDFSLTDLELSKDINSLANALKIVEDAKFNTDTQKKYCLWMYSNIYELKNKLNFLDLGLCNEKGLSFYEVGVAEQDENVIKEINAIIKRHKKILCINKQIGEINAFMEPECIEDVNFQTERLLRELGQLYSTIANYDEAIKYFEEAYENHCSISSASRLISYYTALEGYIDIDKALKIQDKMLEFKYKDQQEKWLHIHQKFIAIKRIYDFYYNLGDYNNALYIIQNAKNKEEKNAGDVTLYDNLINDAQNKINELSNAILNYNELSTYFKSNILTIMPDDIKVFIQTSLAVYNTLNNINQSMDYSSAIIPLLKGIENLLYEIYINGYLNYLKTLNNIDFNEIHSSFYYTRFNKEYLKNQVEDFKIGNAIYSSCYIHNNFGSINSSPLYTPNKYFINFCKDICDIDNPNEFIIELTKTLEEIKTIRNKVAHRFRITKTDAEKCIDILLKHKCFINYLYSNFYKLLNK